MLELGSPSHNASCFYGIVMLVIVIYMEILPRYAAGAGKPYAPCIVPGQSSHISSNYYYIIIVRSMEIPPVYAAGAGKP